jgi:hypothetical protein
VTNIFGVAPKDDGGFIVLAGSIRFIEGSPNFPTLFFDFNAQGESNPIHDYQPIDFNGIITDILEIQGGFLLSGYRAITPYYGDLFLVKLDQNYNIYNDWYGDDGLPGIVYRLNESNEDDQYSYSGAIIIPSQSTSDFSVVASESYRLGTTVDGFNTVLFNISDSGQLNDSGVLVEDTRPTDWIMSDDGDNFLLLLNNGDIIFSDKNGNTSDFAKVPLAEVNEGVRSIVKDNSDGGYIVCGSTDLGITNQTRGTFVMKIDQNGAISSSKRSFNNFSSSGITTFPGEIYQTKDSNFIINGFTNEIVSRTYYSFLDCI